MPFTEAFLVNLAAQVAASLMGATGRKLRKRLTEPQRRRALTACCTAGVAALVASAEAESPDHQTLLGEILQAFFTAEETGRELQPLLRAEPLDGETLLELFAEAGYVSEQLPGLDLPQALAKVEAAFVAAAVRQPALQGEIRTRQALEQTALLKEIRTDVGRLADRGTALPGAVRELLRRPGPAAGPLRTAYLNRLLERLRRLPLTGIDPKAASPEASPEVELATVYTALLTTTPAEPEGRRAPEPTSRGEPRRLSALEVLDREAKLALLGEPGSGKTTFLAFVALCLTGEGLGSAEANLERLRAPLPPAEGEEEPRPQPWRWGPLLPVHVVLRDLAARGLGEPGEPADGDTLWRFLVTELGEALADFAPLLRDELLQRGGLVLLDGLDEVPDAGLRRAQVKDAVAGFAATFPKCRFLVTSRTYAYQNQEWKLPGFTQAVLAPFAPFQVRHFVHRWYAHVGPQRGLTPEQAEGGATLLKAAIAGNERLAELARRPLLLTLMASLHAWRSGTLPERREELYADAVELLLDQWEGPKVVRDGRGRPVIEQPSLAQWLQVDRERVRRELDRLAFEAHRDQPELRGTADVTEATLVAALFQGTPDPQAQHRRLVEFLSQRSGLLAARGEGVYNFPHRTFQEYLAACHLTRSEYPYRVARLGRSDPQRWREVVLLAGAKAGAGTPSALWALAGCLCPEEAAGPPSEEAWGTRLAGDLLAESADLGAVEATERPKLERVRLRLVEVLRGEELPALERARAGQALARLGDPREEVTTVAAMELCPVPAGPFLSGEKGKEREVPYPYWISRFPVTQAQYAEFSRAGGYREARYWEEARSAGVWDAGRVKDSWGGVSVDGPEAYSGPFSLPNHPVVGVTWYEALAFSRWLTERMRAEGLPAGWEVRLPSEGEWEKAACGGRRLPAAGSAPPSALGALCSSEEERSPAEGSLDPNPLPRRAYPWGDEEPTAEHANFDATGVQATSAVGCFPQGRSPYGCEELAGNVWERCSDVLEGDPAVKPDSVVALRGGSWALPARGLAAAVRGWYGAWYRVLLIGFRCVLVRSSERG